MHGVALGAFEQPVTDEQGWDAWAWLESAAREFGQLGAKIHALRHRAAVVSAEAGRAGRLEDKAEAQRALIRLNELWHRWDGVNERLQSWGLVAPPSALGALAPWAWLGIGAATVVATAATAAWVLARFGAEARIVQLLEQQQLTPDEAERLLRETEGSDPFGAIGSVTAALLLGGGLLFLMQLRDR